MFTLINFLYRCKNWGTVRLTNSTKDTQPVHRQAGDSDPGSPAPEPKLFISNKLPKCGRSDGSWAIKIEFMPRTSWFIMDTALHHLGVNSLIGHVQEQRPLCALAEEGTSDVPYCAFVGMWSQIGFSLNWKMERVSKYLACLLPHFLLCPRYTLKIDDSTLFTQSRCSLETAHWASTANCLSPLLGWRLHEGRATLVSLVSLLREPLLLASIAPSVLQ